MILTKPPTGKEFENRGTFVSLRESKVNLAERAWFISPVLDALFATSSSRFARVYLRWLLVSFLNLLVMLSVGHAFSAYPKPSPGKVSTVADASYLTGDYIMYVCASFVSKLLQIFLAVRYVALIETRAETPGWSALYAYIEQVDE